MGNFKSTLLTPLSPHLAVLTQGESQEHLQSEPLSCYVSQGQLLLLPALVSAVASQMARPSHRSDGSSLGFAPLGILCGKPSHPLAFLTLLAVLS